MTAPCPHIKTPYHGKPLLGGTILIIFRIPAAQCMSSDESDNTRHERRCGRIQRAMVEEAARQCRGGCGDLWPQQWALEGSSPTVALAKRVVLRHATARWLRGGQQAERNAPSRLKRRGRDGVRCSAGRARRSLARSNINAEPAVAEHRQGHCGRRTRRGHGP